MSTTDQYHCGNCSKTFDHPTVKGSFCSMECFHRNRGKKVLRHIDSMHNWCSTCFRPIKDVIERQEFVDLLPAGEKEPPTCFVGTQHPTTTTETMVVDESEVDGYHQMDMFTRWGCECGAVNPSTRSETIREANLKTTKSSLLASLEKLERDGIVQNRTNESEFYSALEEKPKDWEYAIGRALQ